MVRARDRLIGRRGARVSRVKKPKKKREKKNEANQKVERIETPRRVDGYRVRNNFPGRVSQRTSAGRPIERASGMKERKKKDKKKKRTTTCKERCAPICTGKYANDPTGYGNGGKTSVAVREHVIKELRGGKARARYLGEAVT